MNTKHTPAPLGGITKQSVGSNLRKGTTKCPICKQPLHFEIMGTMRIVRDDKYSAYCPTDVRYFDVAANTMERREEKRKK